MRDTVPVVVREFSVGEEQWRIVASSNDPDAVSYSLEYYHGEDAEHRGPAAGPFGWNWVWSDGSKQGILSRWYAQSAHRVISANPCWLQRLLNGSFERQSERAMDALEWLARSRSRAEDAAAYRIKQLAASAPDHGSPLHKGKRPPPRPKPTVIAKGTW